jgi:hypothetical protein
LDLQRFDDEAQVSPVRRAHVVRSNDAARVVEIADILGQDLLQIALIEYEHVVEALGPDRPHPALADRVGPSRSEWRARLGNTEITYSPIEAGAIASVAVMIEKTWRLALPAAAFDDLLYRPFDRAFSACDWAHSG